MQRLLSALKSFPLAILDVFLKSLLLIVYVLTALPLGLLSAAAQAASFLGAGLHDALEPPR